MFALGGGLGLLLVLMVLVIVVIACRKSRTSASHCVASRSRNLLVLCTHYSYVRAAVECAEEISESSSSCSAALAAVADRTPVLRLDADLMSAEPREPPPLASSARSTPAHVQLSLPSESPDGATLGGRAGSVPALQFALARPPPGRPPLPHQLQLQLHPQLGHALYSCPPACPVGLPAPGPMPGPTPLATNWTQLTPGSSYKRYSSVLEPSTPQTPLPLLPVQYSVLYLHITRTVLSAHTQPEGTCAPTTPHRTAPDCTNS